MKARRIGEEPIADEWWAESFVRPNRMDYFADNPQFNTLSLRDLLAARDQFHPHLMHKANVVGTALGRYLIRTEDPLPSDKSSSLPVQESPRKKPPRTFENSEVRDYSWPCVLVLVSKWAEDEDFGRGGKFAATDYVPKTIYLADGRRVPICVVLAPPVKTAPPSPSPEELVFPDGLLAPGYPVITRIQGVTRIASIGCLVTNGHKTYALTNRHVAGRSGEKLVTLVQGKEVLVGSTSESQLGRQSFETLYQSWPGRNLYVNLDVGLVELDDLTQWSPSIHGVGWLGPLLDLSVYNFTLNLIGCPVRAHGSASGRLYGRIAALFYRYRSVGGFEYVADFLIGSRTTEPLRTRPGDSGAVWVVESENAEHNLRPIAIQWGGTVFTGAEASLPFALATNLSNVCRELEVDLVRSWELASFEYWGAVGHYSIGSFACEQVINPNLRKLMMANRRRISFEPGDITVATLDNLRPSRFVPLADVPDIVWKNRYNETDYGRSPNENPNHYADMDFAPDGIDSLFELTPTAASLVPQTWRNYYDAVGWTSKSERGLLPFRVWQIYRQMVEYVRGGRLAEFVAAAGVLSHYVGDACQPLHGTYLTDGDPFRFPNGDPSDEMLGLGRGFGGGIHGKYETDMLDEKIGPLLLGLQPSAATHGMSLIEGGQNAGFATVELMRRARVNVRPEDLVEEYGNLVLQGLEWKATTVLWDKYSPGSLTTIKDGYRTLAMLWDSAWEEGGGDEVFNEADLVTQTKQKLRDIYEDRSNFVRSAPLNDIDAFL